MVTPEQFAILQQEWVRPALSHLVQRCQQRFLRAADLVHLRGPVIERIRRATAGAGLDLTPLLPVWQLICERFRHERFDPQMPLFGHHNEEIVERWSQFLYGELFPILLREDECVRNVLRALELLPNQAPATAVAALCRHISEMNLSYGTPVWDSEEMD